MGSRAALFGVTATVSGGTTRLGRTEDNVPPFKGDEPCTQVNPDIFYEEFYDLGVLRLLRSLCAGCDVQVECLQYAMKEDFGFWGGYTANERAKMIRRQRRFARKQVFDAAWPQHEWRVG